MRDTIDIKGVPCDVLAKDSLDASELASLRPNALVAIVERLCQHADDAGTSSLEASMLLLQVLGVAPKLVESRVVRFFGSHPSPASLLANASSLSNASLTIDHVLLCGERMMIALQSSSQLCELWDWTDVMGLFEYPEGREYGKVCLELVLNVRGISGDGGDESVTEETDEGQLEMKEVEARQRAYRSAMYRQVGMGLSDSHTERPATKACLSKRVLGLDIRLTESQQDAMWQFDMALLVGTTAISLEGPPSCGKSWLIEQLARHYGEDDFIMIHLDDQMDSKTLLGGYVCTAKPGEFVWAPGPVVRAARKGCWLVLENINLASPEVITMISSLAKTRRIEISSRGETVIAAHGFRIIATCTELTVSANAHNHLLKAMLSNFLRVHMLDISQRDKYAILENINPSMAPLLPRALSIGDAFAAGLIRVPVNGKPVRVERMFTFRDMIKWARRMKQFWGKVLVGMPRIAVKEVDEDISLVPLAAREATFIEFADCTCLYISSYEARTAMLTTIADMLALPGSVVEDYQRLSKPQLSFHDGAVHIGRASIGSASNMVSVVGSDKKKGTKSTKTTKTSASSMKLQLSTTFAQTGAAMRLMERLSAAVQLQEPILLVGETGVGKTTVIQEIAKLSDKKFAVINLSQQTDSSDLIGGFRPKVPGEDVIGMLPDFIELVKSTWKRGDNEEFLSRVVRLGQKRKWTQLLKAYKAAVKKWSSSSRKSPGAEEKEPRSSMKASSRKRQREDKPSSSALLLDTKWREFAIRTDEMEATSSLMERGFAFGFTEGLLVKAFREGWWLLLDEINLAPTEVLERVAGLLNSHEGWILTERGDESEIKRHPEFRIFGAMNPATDSGKKSLPPLVRDRFTEFWVDEPTEKEDLLTIVSQHLGSLAYQAPVRGIVDLYVAIKQRSMGTLQDGAGVRPVYNLRTLTRALEYARATADTYGVRRALVDGFAMSFQTQLDTKSSSEIDVLLESHLLSPGTSVKSIVKNTPDAPSVRHILFDHYWVEGGDQELAAGETFIATPSVQVNLRNLSRAVLLKKYPILLQGPTSSGKTSLIAHLAAVTGHKCIRINNHEHTDIQEYIGTYMSDAQGRLVFNEGPLVQALRHGYWVILDELNLAPSEVLEALNRLLDDNRELFVPELQEVIAPHKHFMLFATQNPPGIYAGRKTLSKAFRSRFLELHIDDIPDGELHEIIEKRCAVAPSYAKKMIDVMRELQRRRSVSNIFAGRHGYITPRDLFRWANRAAIGYDQLAANGFFVLGERLRNSADKQAVLATLQRELKATINPQELYEKFDTTAAAKAIPGGSRIVWTSSFKRIYYLLERCIENGEPALLVGETGIGKTTACQLLAASRGQRLHILNCNQHTETSDFLGGYRPNRSRRAIAARLREDMSALSIDIPARNSDHQTMIDIAAYIDSHQDKIADETRKSWLEKIAAYHAPFEWVDGPLIHAMRNGDILLIDELNLAEDAVLERLNSVLEASKTVTLAEKSGKEVETIVGHENFQIIGTMNPGGDFGKKELSPALMNRFTSIWVPALRDSSELLVIIESRLVKRLCHLSGMVVDFWLYFEANVSTSARQNLTIREMLCWVEFMNTMSETGLNDLECFRQGVEMAVIDGLGLGSGVEDEFIKALQCQLRQAVEEICKKEGHQLDTPVRGPIETLDGQWGIWPFYVTSQDCMEEGSYNFETETTYDNLYRLLRAMQLARPILLEGSPGVGKTTLIESMSQAVGKQFIRINLSDQTDMMDLLGANLPSPEGDAGEFVWSDGPLLQAMKNGSWVLLDELNLAGQSILEGLNALLDHRGEIFVPELNSVVKCASGFRLFGAQNPVQEGGGRKGLPKSFLNRFIRVRISAFSFQDLLNISCGIHPGIPRPVIQAMTECIWQCASKAGYRGQSCLDFNLRDLLRWCKLVQGKLDEISGQPIQSEALRWSRLYGNMLLADRMRSSEDRLWIQDVLDENLLPAIEAGCLDRFEVSSTQVVVGNVQLPRKSWIDTLRAGKFSFAGSCGGAGCHAILKSYFGVKESLSECVKNNWLSILVGPAGTGRSSSVACLAHLLGKRVVEIPMHPGIDISDLLGGFEQVDVDRDSLAMLSVVKTFLRSLAVVALSESQPLDGLNELWHGLFDGINGSIQDRGVQDTYNVQEKARAAVATIANNRDSFRALIGKFSEECGGNLAKELDRIEVQSQEYLTRGAKAAGKFEWVDGTLTRCILDGSWVILRDANLCNPSVLDRLNPLFEPGGFISLNECGSTDDGARLVIPHPEFRMFITYDPLGGEISRAMRNRGIEINMSVEAPTGLPSHQLGTSPAVSDVVAVMVTNAVPGPVAQNLARIWLSDSSGIPSDKKSVHYLAKWSGMIDALVSSGGIPLDQAVKLSYRQCFNCDLPEAFGARSEALLDQMAADVSFFMYPGLEDVAKGSRMDKALATWSFAVELGKGVGASASPAPYCQIFDEWMAVMEQHGALVATSLAGFAWGNQCHAGIGGEDVMNAVMSICNESSGHALVAEMLARIPSSDCNDSIYPEVTAWKLCLTDIAEQSSNKLTSQAVRVSLEAHRLAGLAAGLPDNLSDCANMLEASAWCHKNRFSQERAQIKDATLLKWMWTALEATYAGMSQMAVGAILSASFEEACDALSLLRRGLMIQGLTTDRERLAHTWQRLIDSLRSCGLLFAAGDDSVMGLGSSVNTLVENVSRLMRGPVSEDVPRCADAFVETIGRPLVALNLELHDVLQSCLALADRLRVDSVRLDSYRSLQVVDMDRKGLNEEIREDKEVESDLVVAMDLRLRSDVLEALSIILAGSLMDVDSLPRLRKILPQIEKLMHVDNLTEKIRSNVDTWAAHARLLRLDGALEHLGTLEELVVRRQEIRFALSLGGVPSATGGSSHALAECMQNTQSLAEGTISLIAATPSRNVADALPFRALVDYHEVVKSRDAMECSEKVKEMRVTKGLRMMALLQAHCDLWSTYPCSAGHPSHAKRGPSSLHQCGVTSSLSKLLKDRRMSSLRNRAARVSQIEKCLSTVLMAHADLMDCDFAALEWQACFTATMDIIRCINGAIGDEEWMQVASTSREEAYHAAVAALEGSSGIDEQIADHLRQSLSLLLLEQSEKGSTESMIKRGKALALTSLVQLSLSRPYKPFDPSLAGEMEREALLYTIEHFYTPEKRIRDFYSHLPLSDQQRDACLAIERRAKALEDRRGAISQLTSARPSESSQYLALREDISTFVSHLVEPTRVQKLISALEEESTTAGAAAITQAQAQAELWCENIHIFIKSMKTKYPCYGDILGPVELGLRSVQYGIGLMSTARTRDAVVEAETLVAGLLTVPSASLSFINDYSLDEILEIIHRDSVDPEQVARATINDKLRLLALRIDGVRNELEHAYSPEHRTALRDEFDRVGCLIHGIWVEIVEQERVRLAQEEAMFEIKARKLEISKDDMQIRRELAVMFPEDTEKLYGDIDEEVDEDRGSDVDLSGREGDPVDTDASNGLDEHKLVMERKQVSDMVLEAIYAAFSELTGIKCEASQRSTQALRFSMGVDMVSRLHGALPSEIDGVSIPGFSFMLGQEWHALTAKPGSQCDKVDMYSPSVEEASRVQRPINQLLERLNQLLDEWPEHPILSQLQKIGARLLDLPLDSPLKSYSTGVELLLSKAQVWEETAAKHVTLKEFLKPLVSVAGHWRQLELNSWKDMLLRARWEVTKEAREAWFFIFGIVNEDFGSMADFINAMDSFIQGSPLGQYQERLALLGKFSTYLAASEEGVSVAAYMAKDEVGNFAREGTTVEFGDAAKRMALGLVMGNLVRYYGQFQPAIDERIASDLKPLEKELADFVKLAKWEDRGFYAMKASAEKAHMQLCKIIRKAKEALWAPASTCLHVQAAQMGIKFSKNDTADRDEKSATMHLLASLEASIKNKPIPVDVPRFEVPLSSRLSESQLRLLGKYSQRVDGISRIFQQFVHSKDDALEGLRNRMRQVDGLSTAALEQAASLQGDTSKGAKARKKKALSDFFKALEASGISKLQSAVGVKDRDPHRWMTIDYKSVSDASYYYESIARLTRLREVSQKPHQDVQAREIHMANNMATHMLYLVQETRAAISLAAPCAAFLKNLTLRIGSFPSVTMYVGLQEAAATFLNEATRCCEWLDGRERVMNGESIAALRLRRTGDKHFDFLNDAELRMGIASWTTLVAQLCTCLAAARPPELEGLNWTSPEMSDAIQTYIKPILSLPMLPTQCPAPLKQAAVRLVDIVSDLSSGQGDRGDRGGPGDVNMKSLAFGWEDFATAYDAAVRACMVWAQEEKGVIGDRTAGEFNQQLGNPSHDINIEAIQRIHAKVKKLLTVLQRLDTSVPGDTVKLLLSQLSPIVKAVGCQTERAVLHLELQHRALAKLSYVCSGIFCSLIENGFCVPHEEDLEGEREEEMDGTGLGDGDTRGAKDISDELEDQDQLLSGGMEERNDGEDQDHRENDGKDDEKGVEMDDDFDGVEEDIERKDGEEDEDEEEDGDEEQLDQQMGDADGEAVDEKVWDKQEEEDQDDKKADGGNDGQAGGEEFAQMSGGDGDDGDDDDGNSDEKDAADRNEDDKGEENDNENQEDGFDGEYEETIDTGYLEHEQPDEPMELPEDLQLEEGDIDQEEDGDEGDDSGDGDQDDEAEQADTEDKEEVNEDLPGEMEMQDAESADDVHAGGNPEEPEDEENQDDDVMDIDAGNNNAGANIEEMDEATDTIANDIAAHQSGAEASEQREDAEGIQEAAGALGDVDGKAVDRAGANGEDAKEKPSNNAPNPFRNVDSAAERWEKKHANVIDLAEDDGGDGGDGEDGGDGVESDEHAQKRFVREEEEARDGDDRVMADATEDQQMDGAAIDDENDDDNGDEGRDEGDDASDEETKQQQFQPQQPDPATETGAKSRGAKEKKDEGVKDGEDRTEGVDLQDQEEENDKAAGDEGQDARYRDPVMQIMPSGGMGNDEKHEHLQEQLSRKIERDNRIGRGQMSHTDDDVTDIEESHAIWETCCQLTSQLSAELAEQLRLILEPTLASKLGGEYRSGKRINMKRVIGYIASHFRKDKIWMRRTQPDKRRHRVLLAIDDSKSMAETSCGAFALESLALICNAMSRLEIGDMGVVRFGGSVRPEILHAFGSAFSSSVGGKIVSKMRFDADNTIDDRPIVDLLEFISDECLSTDGAVDHAIKELVIILADGRFHEKEALKKAVMDATSRPGVMYAFVVLGSSILDMQSVEFSPETGRPVFKKYIDEFPFPLYVCVSEVRDLPMALGSIVRGWMEIMGG